MSRFVRPPKPQRSQFAPTLSPKQEADRVAQSKADRKKIVVGIALRATQRKAARWTGLAPKRLPPGRKLPADEVKGLQSKTPTRRLAPKLRKLWLRTVRNMPIPTTPRGSWVGEPRYGFSAGVRP